MRSETALLLTLGLASLVACDRSGTELLPQPNDNFPSVLEVGQLQVVSVADLSSASSSSCNQQDADGAYNCYYGDLSPTDGVTQGGATFEFKGTGGKVCVMVDPEAVFWNQFIGSEDAAIQWGYPDNNTDDGDLDLFSGLSTYYTGSPGIEIGNFKGYYTDDLGRQIAIDYVECFNESPYNVGVEAHAGRGSPEYCTIDTAGREGILYTVVLSTFSVPLDDGLLSFGSAVVDGKCSAIGGGVGGGSGIDECTLQGEALDEAGNTKECTTELEQAFCLNSTESSSAHVLTRFCCLHPDMCGPSDASTAEMCANEDLDNFCLDYPQLCDCASDN